MKINLATFILFALLSGCTLHCKDEYCFCPDILVDFLVQDTLLDLNASLIDRISMEKLDSALYVEWSSDTIFSLRLTGTIKGEPKTDYQPEDYYILLQHSNSNIDTLSIIEYKTFRCNDGFCGKSVCVRDDETFKFKFKNKIYSLDNAPITLN